MFDLRNAQPGLHPFKRARWQAGRALGRGGAERLAASLFRGLGWGEGPSILPHWGGATVRDWPKPPQVMRSGPGGRSTRGLTRSSAGQQHPLGEWAPERVESDREGLLGLWPATLTGASLFSPDLLSYLPSLPRGDGTGEWAWQAGLRQVPAYAKFIPGLWEQQSVALASDWIHPFISQKSHPFSFFFHSSLTSTLCRAHWWVL